MLLLTIMFALLRHFGCFKYTYNFFFSKQSNNLIIDEKYSDIDTIKIDVDRANIVIKESTDERFHVVIYSDFKTLKSKQYNKKLNIMTYNKCKFCVGNSLSNIKILIPINYSGMINIENSYGNTSIDGFKNSTMFIYNKFGNLEIKNGKLMYIKTLYGNINLDIIHDARIKQTVGDIFINEINNVKINNKLSNIYIKKIKNYINSNLDYANLIIDYITIKKDSSINSISGSITIKDYNNLKIINKYYDTKEEGKNLRIDMEAGKLKVLK